MPTVKKSAIVPFSSAAMFDLVAAVEEYPEFLPWCGGSQVHQRTDHGMVATVRIAYRGLSQSFTTENVHERPYRIEMQLRDGPFSRLHGVWSFKALTPEACRVELEMDYELRSGMIAQLLGPVFEQIAKTMVDAFVDRAEALAGGL
jgi:ribosome-associated toxin RatA of RatAB toxin-antitoxin module